MRSWTHSGRRLGASTITLAGLFGLASAAPAPAAMALGAPSAHWTLAPQHLRGTIAGGGPRLHVETVNGSVELRKGGSQ